MGPLNYQRGCKNKTVKTKTTDILSLERLHVFVLPAARGEGLKILVHSGNILLLLLILVGIQ